MIYEYGCFGNVALTKAMEILTALNTKLLKIFTVNVLESKYNSKISNEIVKVLEDSGEGRFFLLPAGAREQ
ncbi:hypothetical protein [Flavobacterium luteum]|uniref:Uncharacterized protein n=1 Tax=Flavobacterium luteum TaxID=2026654 RepID=A0A7J5AB61_9FLAO|nr:hypothetical protein [Flavobacterium luteum]KAB1154796.1 hypothetical protein F6464_12155 [Flavobacterium luteum]